MVELWNENNNQPPIDDDDEPLKKKKIFVAVIDESMNHNGQDWRQMMKCYIYISHFLTFVLSYVRFS